MAEHHSAKPGPHTRRWLLGGRVQGVGFRPFVYRVACRHHIRGWVRNLTGRVEILGQGEDEALQQFEQALLAEAPPLARPVMIEEANVQEPPLHGFSILASRPGAAAQVAVPPDYFACDDCLAEMRNPRDRRYRYPFINCTQCGPRYTLIDQLPYDRARTTMRGFTLCARCAAEYADPGDRRFHAEPTACPDCGPSVTFVSSTTSASREPAIAACIAALRAGEVVAVKGVGGYHLLCDARNPTAVAALRLRKSRPHKPLAIMFPAQAWEALGQVVHLDAEAEAQLRDPMRPVVLLPRKSTSELVPGIAPDCPDIGVMLPYSPLHHLLLDGFGAPVVATSGNVSGEPVLTDNAEAEAHLGCVADAFLHHDRPIARPADDSVFRVIAGKARPVRLGRGCAPLELELPCELARPTLALGAHLKNTIALGWGRRAVVSPHLGDMDAPRSVQLLEQLTEDFQRLYGVRAEAIACDAHPDYATSRLAKHFKLPVTRVFHHRAHASAVAGEFGGGDWLVFTWDGSGYGEDGTLWGGEALLGTAGNWRRVGSLRPFVLIGGERAAFEPWRCALALCWEAGLGWSAPVTDIGLVRGAWERAVNCPPSSSAGRLFDGAAALLGLVSRASFEAQGPMALEAACSTASSKTGDPVALPLYQRADGLWISDWQPMIERLLESHRSVAEQAAMVHATLAAAILDQAQALRSAHGVSRIGLAGGVFQNRFLCEQVAALAEANGFDWHIPQALPCNDAAISFGQLVEASAVDKGTAA